MKNSILMTALESAPIEDTLPQDDFIEQVEELRDNSSEFTPNQMVEEELQLQEDVGAIDTLAEHVEHIEPENTVAMEALVVGLNAIASKYGMSPLNTSMESGTDQREAVHAHIAHIKASLESALVVSQESWAVKDLWDSIGAVERNSTELESTVRQLNDRKQWFSENGIVIDSSRHLQYMTFDNELTKNFVKDTETTLNHADNLLTIAEQAMDTSEKIRDLVRSANIGGDEDALDLLKKVVALKNPSVAGKQKLDGVRLLNNMSGVFEVKVLKNNNALNVGDWEKVGLYYPQNLGRLQHGVKRSLGLRVPAWILATGASAHVAKTVVGGLGGLAPVLVIGYAVTMGVLTVKALNDGKAAKAAKHSIKFEDVKAAFDKCVSLSRKSASTRRSMPGLFEHMNKLGSEVVGALSAVKSQCGPEGRAAIAAINGIYISSERLGWSLNQSAFGLMRDVVTNSNGIANKLDKASKQ